MSENRFVFVVPTFNASQTVVQTILSVFAQTYPHWHIMFRDDVSTDGTPDVIRQVVNALGISSKVTLVVNEEKKWEVANILDCLKECQDDDIVCRLDGDDWLSDLDALAIINHRYWETGCEALWTKHRWGFSDYNISGPMAPDADPYKHPWVSSHLKTFRKRLLNNVSDSNFRDQDGEYFKRIGDQAIYLPVLQQTKKRHFEPIVAYHYTIDMQPATFQTDDAKFQRDEAIFLRTRGYVR